MRTAVFAICLLILTATTRPLCALSNRQAGEFLRALAADSASLENIVQPEELALSRRFGIRYTNHPERFLVGAGLDSTLAASVRAGHDLPFYKVDSLGAGFFRLNVPANPQGSRAWYFQGDRLVSPLVYFTRGQPRRESRDFRFLATDNKLPGDYSIRRLENFCASVCDRLGYSDSQRELLAREKILYVLCGSESRLEELTGFRARGMCLLAWDAVISTWPCHFHELVHDLVNLRLGRLSTDTHPFFLEGLAVALGGRGGREPQPVLDLGLFLVKSGVLDYRELLTRDGFYGQDPSLAYPVAGLYNLFLLEYLGAERYLQLYRSYNAPAGSSLWRDSVSTADLPPDYAWQSFLDSRRQFAGVGLDPPPTDSKPSAEGPGWSVRDCGDSWAFSLRDSLFVLLPDSSGSAAGKQSGPRFTQTAPPGGGDAFLVTADSLELRLVCRETGNLVANFAGQLSLGESSLPVRDGRFVFRLDKSLFSD